MKSSISIWHVLGLVLAAFTVVAAQAQEKPNIILIMTDDVGYGDLAGHEQPFDQTLSIDDTMTEAAFEVDLKAGPADIVFPFTGGRADDTRGESDRRVCGTPASCGFDRCSRRSRKSRTRSASSGSGRGTRR